MQALVSRDVAHVHARDDYECVNVRSACHWLVACRELAHPNSNPIYANDQLTGTTMASSLDHLVDSIGSCDKLC